MAFRFVLPWCSIAARAKGLMASSVLPVGG